MHRTRRSWAGAGAGEGGREGARAVVARLAGHRRRPRRTHPAASARGGVRRGAGAGVLGGGPRTGGAPRTAPPGGPGAVPLMGRAHSRPGPRRQGVRARGRRGRRAGAGGGDPPGRAWWRSPPRARRAGSAGSGGGGTPGRPGRRPHGRGGAGGVRRRVVRRRAAARRAVAVAPGDTPAFLATLGVEELDREPDIDRSALVDLLRRLGLLSLGAFAALDAADVASRFGADAVLCHRLARGLDPRPPLRRRPPEELDRRKRARPTRRSG